VLYLLDVHSKSAKEDLTDGEKGETRKLVVEHSRYQQRERTDR
jgi:hypothetical protein